MKRGIMTNKGKETDENISETSLAKACLRMGLKGTVVLILL